jgi:hypothetical protein
MTEEEWLVCADPVELMRAIMDRTSERKRILVICACCRHLWDWLSDDFRKIVGHFEQIAEDSKHPERIWEHDLGSAFDDTVSRAPESVQHALYALDAVMNYAWRDDWLDIKWVDSSPWIDERKVQVLLVRDIVGNPFRCFNDAASRPSSKSGAIGQLAQTIYADRTFDRLPILADALEEAGCTQVDVLRHLRNCGEHVRGCWALDLVLGKE